MKLSRTQISALTDVIFKEIEKEYESKMKFYMESKTALTNIEQQIKKYLPVLKLIESKVIVGFKIKDYFNVINSRKDLETAIESLEKTKFAKGYKKPQRSDIENEIILSSIGANNVEEMKTYILKKFVK